MDVTEPTSDLHPGFSGEASAVELAHLGAARCRLEQGAEGWARLGVQGRLPRGWSVRLTGGLARRGVSLVAGHARRHAGDAWRIELELDLGTVAYKTSGRNAKTVRYWRMEAGEGKFKRNSEVDRVLWLPAKRALEKLTHELDR